MNKMKYIRFFNSRPVLAILLAALFFTFLVGVASFYIMRIYQAIQPIWVEQAGNGQAPMLAFLGLLKKEGLWRATLQLGDERHILQVLILGILYPSLLGWFHAPLLVVLPTFAIFLILYGWTIYQRSNHLGYAVASMFFFCTINQLTRHNWGVGSGFADWQSLFLLSAAMLALLNALIMPSIGWIRLFSILVSLSALARTTSAFYAFVICAPVLLLYLIYVYRRTNSIKNIAITIGNVFVFIAPAALIVIEQLSRMFLYYGSVNAWNLHQPFIVSAQNIFYKLLVPFLGIPLISVCMLLFLWNIFEYFLNRKQKTYSITDQRNYTFSNIAVFWWLLGYLVFLLIYGYTSDVPKEVMYAVPAFLLLSFVPFVDFSNKIILTYRFLSPILFFISIIFFAWHFRQNVEFVRNVSSEQAVMRSVQQEMARKISSLPESTIWQSYTSIDWGIPVSLITYYEFGAYRQYGGVDYFYNKKEYWDTWYPNMSIVELQNELYERTVNCIDAVVVLKKPDQQPADMEDYSYAIAAFIANKVRTSSSWEAYKSLKGWPDGTKYQIYLNHAPASIRSCTKNN